MKIRRKIKVREMRLIKLALIFLAGYFLVVVLRSVRNSILFYKRDRIDIIYYGQETTFISLGLRDKVNYIGFFDNDLGLLTPGGYGRYNVGSLGRLSNLEKNPRIIERAFSSATSNYIDYYLLPKKSPIFFGQDHSQSDKFFIPKLNLLDVFFPFNIATDASFLDRLYLFFLMADMRKSDFAKIGTYFPEAGNEKQFSEDDFAKKYKGYFYQKTLREEEKNVQLIYKKYLPAKTLSRIIEGEGISVVDLTETDGPIQNCIIKESGSSSKTAAYLTRRFNCLYDRGDTQGYDIVMVLGEKLESEWE